MRWPLRERVPVAVLDLVAAALRLEHNQAMPRVHQHEIRLTVTRRTLAASRGNEPQPVHDYPVIAEFLERLEYPLFG